MSFVAVAVAGVAVALGGGGVAVADPVIELGPYAGARWFTANNQLGNSPYPDQVVRTGGAGGLRLAWLALPHLGGSATDATRVQVALELEGSVIPTHLGSVMQSGGARPRYAATIAGARAQLALRIARWDAVPHLVVGAGFEYLSTRSPYVENDPDPVVYYGLGATVPIGHALELRFDIRNGFMAGRDGDWAPTLEVQGGLQFAFGGTYQRPPLVQYVTRTPLQATTEVTVTIADDPAPRAAPPPPLETDRDHDGLVGAADRCPDNAEDKDGTDDTDGCPDPDNDRDGILDAVDKCPDQLETMNGWLDGDGCPDQIPTAVTATVELVATVKFEPGRARVTPAGRTVLRGMLKALDAYPRLQLVLAGHPTSTDKDDTLARKRAEAVKWYLVDQGLVATQIEVTVGGVARQAVTATFH